MATKCITPLCILSFPRLDKPTPGEDGKPDKYSAALVFSPELLADPAEKKLFDALQAAGVAAVAEKFGNKATNLLQSDGFKKGFRRDIAGKGYPEGSIYLNARSEQKPGIVYGYAGPDGRPARMPDDKIKNEMFPGVIVRASVTPFAFARPDNKGLSFALNNLQFVRVGPRLDGHAAAEDEFAVDLSAAPASLADLGGE
jgi:hypothetical protein